MQTDLGTIVGLADEKAIVHEDPDEERKAFVRETVHR
jgi:hypothetical protein